MTWNFNMRDPGGFGVEQETEKFCRRPKIDLEILNNQRKEGIRTRESVLENYHKCFYVREAKTSL